MDQSAIVQNRGERRAKVLLSASIEVGGRSLSAKLRDLCAGGALIEGDALPVEGSRVRFCREHLTVSCRVAWAHGRRAALAFDAAIRPEDVLRAIRPGKPTAPMHFRRPGVRSHKVSAEELALIQLWS
jgi:PilZ domain